MLSKLLVAAASIATVCIASNASANNTVWIHGRNTSGTPSGFSYWSHSSYGAQGITTGVNATAANYDGTAHITVSGPGQLWSQLDAACGAGKNCYIACHSAGCSQIGYAVAYNPSRWNIIYVETGGAASGGSELASAGSWMTGYDIDSDLHVGTMRGLYDHDALGNDIQGYVYNFLGHDWATPTTGFFPGADDSAVAYHSSGFFRTSGSYHDGDATASGATGGSFWNYTKTWYLDSGGSKGHCIVGNYPCQEGDTAGIMGVVAGSMAGAK
jgi:hypothetical protein